MTGKLDRRAKAGIRRSFNSHDCSRTTSQVTPRWAPPACNLKRIRRQGRVRVMTRDVRHRSDAGETRFLIRFIDRYGPPGSGGPGLGASGAARTNRCDQFVAREANGYKAKGFRVSRQRVFKFTSMNRNEESILPDITSVPNISRHDERCLGFKLRAPVRSESLACGR